MATVNMIVRIDKKLHKDLVTIAKSRHQSLNGLINSVMEAEVKRVEKKVEKSFGG